MSDADKDNIKTYAPTGSKHAAHLLDRDEDFETSDQKRDREAREREAGRPKPGTPGVPASPEQFATRRQDLERRAGAAGASRSGNDADLLGYTGTARRGASRVILGY